MKTPRWTDKHRYPMPYVTAEQSRAEGYLAERFRLIREQQALDEKERREKVRQVKRA